MIRKTLPSIIDSHCHIDFPEFDNDLDQVLNRAHKAGVSKILTICTKPANLQKVLTIVSAHRNIFFAAGSHPLNNNAKDRFTKEELLEATLNAKMVGIGETGLDYFYSSTNSNDQKKDFRLHIALARECSLPLIIHSRKADEDMTSILKDEYKSGPFRCVLHCFSSGAKLARVALELGFYLSISGIAVFPKSQELREILSTVPLNRLLVETDSPYLAPPPFRGKRNEPSYVTHTAKAIAEHFGISESLFRQMTSDNFNELFKKTKL